MALIPSRYASALFQLALENDCVDKYYDDIRLVYDTISSDSEIMAVLNHPQISAEEKLDILKNAFEGKVSGEIIGFFNVIFKKNRENELLGILEEYIKKSEDFKGIAYATVESAEALSKQTLDSIVQNLSKNLNKQIRIEAKVVPELIGGLKISVCGHVVDSTVKTQIDNLRKQLLSLKLAQ